jgi:hypothetical protein
MIDPEAEHRNEPGRAAFWVVAVVVLAVPGLSWAHAERPSQFPPGFPDNTGTVPVYRPCTIASRGLCAEGGRFRVVCARDSRLRIEALAPGPARDRSLQLVRMCHHRSIQKAVRRAQSGDHIFIMPGVYTERRSRRKPYPDPRCKDLFTTTEGGAQVPSYEYQRKCPNAQNLIAIIGDTDGDHRCDTKCSLQIEGTGAVPEDVVIQGDRFSQPGQKLNGIRADRADGIYLRNFTVEFFDFNGVYFHETDGFVFDRIVARYNREYGVLSFTSDHGLYKDCETYVNGDSGVYPGSGPNLHAVVNASHPNGYGIEITGCDVHDNQMGYSGTAGGGAWVHHNRFHDNAVGVVTDSLIPDHPGMPEDSCKWSENLIYSNNLDLFNAERDEYCKKPASERDLTILCPTFGVPVGSGLLIAAGNSNIVERNYIFDNWRLGTMLFWVPATFRGEDDPSRQTDTSNNNRQQNNCMGVRPAVLDPQQVDFSTCSGTPDPNGIDFWWDEQEGTDCTEGPGSCVDAADLLGNCWSSNVGPGGGAPTSDPPVLPTCPGIDVPRGPNLAKSALLVDCTNWNPQTNTDPPGCQTPADQSWFDQPPEP